MDELFGRVDNQEELFSPLNGFMMCAEAEIRIANGWLVLVPDVTDNASATELEMWSDAHIKEYKLRVLSKSAKLMGSFVGDQHTDPKLWRDLDGQKVQFRSDHRPRAAWQTDYGSINSLAEKFGKRFWGTKGSWIKRKYLLAFTEYLGHAIEWDNLLEAAIAPETEEDNRPDPVGLLIACKQIRCTNKKLASGWRAKFGYEDSEEESDSEII
ncbi:hypothetical protein MMC13_004660 [Lambiella insularis]|nr:hypothetical protein [Lambiella insularis]